MDYIKQEEIKKFDEVIETEGVKVIVDTKAVMALVGSEMRFE
jgi:Fe-S cluster assembly iron-binding protein IscA